MPLIKHSSYVPPRFLKNPHIQTIYPFVARPVLGVNYRRERIQTPDGDFLDLDWSYASSKRLAILSHGLEGHSRHSYMLGMVKALNNEGISALSWNLRGCGGEVNVKEHFYHGGMTEDLQAVIESVYPYFDEIYLIGFSLGGNITLKYLGELGDKVPPKVCCAVNFSVPIDLKACSYVVNDEKNWVYFKKFMHSIRSKVNAKSARVNFSVPIELLKKASSFKDLDDWFTAPLFGFNNAEHLWEEISSKKYVEKIRIPTLLVSSEDDPILAAECYPTELARQSDYVYFEMPSHGGHVGFVALNWANEYWSESRAVEFIEEHRGTRGVKPGMTMI
ncbi:MAG: alpha/beta fold hydrolase [Deltaproteobacteria bacterium]|nr:alpha/beta fold hydrolase [Deltaproteobacteria bacterium]